MTPIYQIVANAIFRLKRTCPKCTRSQIVPGSKRLENVHCKFCGADIPPRK